MCLFCVTIVIFICCFGHYITMYWDYDFHNFHTSSQMDLNESDWFWWDQCHIISQFTSMIKINIRKTAEKINKQFKQTVTLSSNIKRILWVKFFLQLKLIIVICRAKTVSVQFLLQFFKEEEASKQPLVWVC